ncbi:MAG: hypothetical protein ABH983_02955 [Candidatus Micrarchaeota archaeon]
MSANKQDGRGKAPPFPEKIDFRRPVWLPPNSGKPWPRKSIWTLPLTDGRRSGDSKQGIQLWMNYSMETVAKVLDVPLDFLFLELESVRPGLKQMITDDGKIQGGNILRILQNRVPWKNMERIDASKLKKLIGPSIPKDLQETALGTMRDLSNYALDIKECEIFGVTLTIQVFSIGKKIERVEFFENEVKEKLGELKAHMKPVKGPKK